jgi:hypothetical protein
MQDGDPWFVCKHCDAACGNKDDENGFSTPDEIVVRNAPVCEGCEYYERDCECEDTL